MPRIPNVSWWRIRCEQEKTKHKVLRTQTKQASTMIRHWCRCWLFFPIILVSGLKSSLPPISQCVTTMLLFDRDIDRWLGPSELTEVLSRLYGCEIDDDSNELYESIRCICKSYGGSESCCDEGVSLAGTYPAGYLNDVCLRMQADVMEHRQNECSKVASPLLNDSDGSLQPDKKTNGRAVWVVVLLVGISTLTTLFLIIVVSKRWTPPKKIPASQQRDDDTQAPLSPLELLRESSGTPLGILRPTDIPEANNSVPVLIATGSFSPGNTIRVDSPRPATIEEVSYESSSVEDLPM